MKIFIGFILCFCSFFITSCDSNDANKECEFVMDPNTQDGAIDDEERQIMSDCIEHRLLSVQEVKQNLLGRWELEGFGHGWVASVDEPCSYIDFSDDAIEFSYTNAWGDTLTVHSYEVLENRNGTPIVAVEPNFPFGVFLGIFCENYMFGDATPVDGDMHLYKKVD